MKEEIPPAPEEHEPSEHEIRETLERIEEQLVADPGGSFETPARKHDPQHESSIAYYERACSKAHDIIETLDPNLTVAVDEVLVGPDDPNGQEYRTYVLRFAHRRKPDLRWTMEIEENDEYIERELERAVRRIYQRKLLDG